MRAIDICFFASNEQQEKRSIEFLLNGFIAEGAEARCYHEDHMVMTRYVARLWSCQRANDLLHALIAIGIHPSPDIFFSRPYDAGKAGVVHQLIALFLPFDSNIRIVRQDVFLSGTNDKTHTISYEVFLSSPEENKRSVAENFADKLRAAWVIPDEKPWNVIYIPKYLP